jgi:hypothetical protein
MHSQKKFCKFLWHFLSENMRLVTFFPKNFFRSAQGKSRAAWSKLIKYLLCRWSLASLAVTEHEISLIAVVLEMLFQFYCSYDWLQIFVCCICVFVLGETWRKEELINTVDCPARVWGWREINASMGIAISTEITFVVVNINKAV